MKAFLFLAATILVSQATFAATPEEVLNNFQDNHKVTCEFKRSSSMKICLNTLCEHTEYYNCGGTTLVLKINSIQYPDGSSYDKVTSYSVGGF